MVLRIPGSCVHLRWVFSRASWYWSLLKSIHSSGGLTIRPIEYRPSWIFSLLSGDTVLWVRFRPQPPIEEGILPGPLPEIRATVHLTSSPASIRLRMYSAMMGAFTRHAPGGVRNWEK